MPRRRREQRDTTRPYDAATKHLVEADPRTWLGYVGLPTPAPVTPVDADISTVLAAADKVLRVAESRPWLAHIELQASYDRALPSRTLHYNVLLYRRHGLPVESIVVLLRPSADGPEMTGSMHVARADGVPYLEFTYRVVRAWQQSVELVLAGGLATLPLAPLADISETDLPGVIRGMSERIAREATPDLERTLWAATYLLAGLRYPPEVAQMIESYSRALRESSTYQKILDEGRAEGRAEEARRILVRLGTRRLKRPDARTRAALNRIDDAERLERMAERVLDATTWADVLSTD